MNTQNISDLATGYIHPTVYEFFLTFNLIICSDLIGSFGIVGNIINILNFTKQGLQESVTITLTALAISDICFLLFQISLNILVCPFWNFINLPFSPSASMLFVYPQGYFFRVSGYITAFAAFERYMSVVLPLKVKRILSRKVAIVVNSSIYIVLLLYLFPLYYVSYLDLKYIPQTNRSVLTLFYRENADSVFKVTFFINDLILPYISFCILSLCTVFLIIRLKSKAVWRRSVTLSRIVSKTEIISIKEKKTSVMLTTVSVIFLVCLTPNCALLTAVGVVRDLNADGAFFPLTMLVVSFTSLLETINCSVNALVYYKMSSKYRETIHTWFPYLRKYT